MLGSASKKNSCDLKELTTENSDKAKFRKEKRMNESVLISIIMPVYNPGKYLHTAIMGILSQSYENLELICINDASTDGSDHVLLQYQKHNKRIRLVHHKENTGAARSRNEGIELASGKYIFFVDADDVFEKDLLKCMVQVAEQESADMVYISYDTFEDGDQYSSDIRGDYYYFGEWFSQYNKKEKCPKGLLRSIPLAPYSRLYSSEFIRDNKLQFQDLKSSNDVYFGIMATFLSKKVAFSDEQVSFVHVRTHGGRYRISNQRNPYDNFTAYAYLLREMKKLRMPDINIEIVQERFLDNMLWELKGCTSDQREEFYQFIRREGLKEMEILKEDGLVNLAPVFQKIAESFYGKSLKSKWFETFSLVECYIETNKRKIIKLFDQIASQGKLCGIWGAGKDGLRLANFCAENHCRCKGFIDSDEKKWGETIAGYEIFPPEDALGTVNSVIVLNQKYFNDIYDRIKAMHKGIEMVSLCMYLQYEQDLYSSTITVAG